MSRRLPRFAVAALAAFLLVPAAALLGDDASEGRVLDARAHHLGKRTVKDWPEAPAEAEGWRLDVDFEAKPCERGATLVISHRNVKSRWTVALNGAVVGALRVEEGRRAHHYPVPAGALAQGKNRLTFVPERAEEDVTIGEVRLIERPLGEVLALGRVDVRIRDARGGGPLAARLTISDAGGRPADVYLGGPTRTAQRRGVVYTADGFASFEAPAGAYTVAATRGVEWGIDRAALLVTAGAAQEVRLSVAREVDTSGMIACDPHIHTFTHSGHGDASMEERMATLPAEGVELAVATDHNHNIDYRPLQRAMGLGASFTAVTGNEVTSKNGHFNAFPLDAKDPVPPWKESDWGKLAAGMRARGARVVILNHPRWPTIEKGPFGIWKLDRASGAREGGPDPLPVDAMEVINAGCPQKDPLFLFQDWFALLSRGERIAAIGASDSHTVDDPVGQARTYIPSATDDPAAVDVAAACERIRRGETTVSYGIFADVRVDGSHAPGAIAPATGTAVRVDLRVAAPSWVRPRRALVFLDGKPALERAIDATPGRPTDAHLSVPLALGASARDAYVVCVVLGDAVGMPHWPGEKGYTLAATNPVWLDRDGDGKHAMRRGE